MWFCVPQYVKIYGPKGIGYSGALLTPMYLITESGMWLLRIGVSYGFGYPSMSRLAAVLKTK